VGTHGTWVRPGSLLSETAKTIISNTNRPRAAFVDCRATNQRSSNLFSGNGMAKIGGRQINLLVQRNPSLASSWNFNFPPISLRLR